MAYTSIAATLTHAIHSGSLVHCDFPHFRLCEYTSARHPRSQLRNDSTMTALVSTEVIQTKHASIHAGAQGNDEKKADGFEFSTFLTGVLEAHDDAIRLARAKEISVIRRAERGRRRERRREFAIKNMGRRWEGIRAWEKWKKREDEREQRERWEELIEGSAVEVQGRTETYEGIVNRVEERRRQGVEERRRGTEWEVRVEGFEGRGERQEISNVDGKEVGERVTAEMLMDAELAAWKRRLEEGRKRDVEQRKEDDKTARITAIVAELREKERQAKDAHTNAFVAKLLEDEKETREKEGRACLTVLVDLLADFRKAKEGEKEREKERKERNTRITAIVAELREAEGEKESREREYAARITTLAAQMAQFEKDKDRAQKKRKSEQVKWSSGDNEGLVRQVPRDSRIPADFEFGGDMVLTKLEGTVIAVRELGAIGEGRL